MYKSFVSFVRNTFSTTEFIPLHEPCFIGSEREYLSDAIDSTFVSSVGKYVDEFEKAVADYTKAKYAIATVNGTSALHTALHLTGVKRNVEVITQPLTFVATCNAIRYCDAIPVFVDVDISTLGLSPESLAAFVDENCELRDDGFCWNKISNRKIAACLPMHSFGLPVELDEIQSICARYNIKLVEDAAESLGSYYKKKHTGTQGDLSAISFNGNKIITAGGGGMILTNNESVAVKAKHITTTAKLPHQWLFDHDEVGFNYRLPNINAALGVAQMEMLPVFLERKRKLAQHYQCWGEENGVQFVRESERACANYWLNTMICEGVQQRDSMLKETNAQGVMTRPAWKPMHRLPMYDACLKSDLKNTEWLYDRLISVPSSVTVQ